LSKAPLAFSCVVVSSLRRIMASRRAPSQTAEDPPGETDEEYKCRAATRRYSEVIGETPEEKEMVDLFKQALAAASRGVISAFADHVLVRRHWGDNHRTTDSSLATSAKTYEYITTWMQVDRSGDFHHRSKVLHDLLHNGFIAMTQAVVNLKTLLTSGRETRGRYGLYSVRTGAEGLVLLPAHGVVPVRVEHEGAEGESILSGYLKIQPCIARNPDDDL
ncbi:MAG: hypothetical protein ACKPKO_59220, partial [Candidatus Fonsibacter sp.]